MKDQQQSIGSRVARATVWTVAMRMTIRLLGIISIIVLARLLVPNDYGIVAKAALVYGLLEMLTQFGLDNALIRDQKAHRGHYDTVWTLHILRGGAIAAVLLLLAKPASVFLRQPELEAILWVYAIISLLGGLVNVGIVDFRKYLQFHLDFRYHVICKICGFVVTIGLAYWYRSYWAFVFGSMAAAVVGVVISYLLSHYRPRIALVEWRSLFNFSKWIFVHETVAALSSKIDTLILSRLSTTETLGLYTISYEVAGTASSEIAMPVARSMLPGLSSVNDDLSAFRELYLSGLSLTLLIALPAALGVSVLSQPITDVLLGAKWEAAGPIIGVLALYGIARVFVSMSISAYVASGRVDVLSKLSIVNLIIRTVAIGGGYYAGGFWGLIWGVVCASGIATALSLTIQQRLALIDLSRLLQRTWRVLLAALSMWGLLHTWPIHLGMGAVIDLATSITVGATAYCVSLCALWFSAGRPRGPEKDFVEYLLMRLRAGRNPDSASIQVR